MSIKVTSIESKVIREVTDHKYRDLSLDLAEDERPYTSSLYTKVTNTDLRVSQDEGAIMNSIKNIFTTKPGEKILSPTFGLDLSKWLFEPVDEFRAREIADAIHMGLERFEPRVKLKNVTVLTDPENHAYRISMAIIIPSLNINSNLKAVLQSPGFDFITENKD